jgi:hypothetical protein
MAVGAVAYIMPQARASAAVWCCIFIDTAPAKPTEAWVPRPAKQHSAEQGTEGKPCKTWVNHCSIKVVV